MSIKVYYEQDASLAQLKGKKICVIGYGSQGRAHAMNLHESGLDVTVAVRDGGKGQKQAQADGLKTQPLAQAVKDADLIAFLLPDPSQPQVYREFVEPICRPGLTLLFAHGFNVHYNQIVPPPMVDVIMVAPKGPGKLVRDLYAAGQGVPCLLAIHQDPSGQAQKNGLAYALAIGGARAGVIETSFREETETDLFGEQAVLCGGLSSLLKMGFEVLVEAGYAPEMAYYECINEMKLIIDLIYQGGLKHMRHYVSDTAKWGDVTCGPKVIDDHVRQNMKKLLEDIQTGVFARQWVLENQANRPVYNALLKREAQHPVEEVGDRLRSMMKWLA